MEENVTINAPADKIFAYVSDFTHHGEWSGHGLQATQIGGGAVAVGTKYSTVAKQFGTQREESTITTMTAPREFAWDSVGALGRIHHSFSLREDAGKTAVTKSVEFVDPKFLAKMMMFKISKDTVKALKSDLSKIKASVEGSAG
jgi:uncharacterized membrane protein